MSEMVQDTSFDVFDRNCPGRAVMEHIASRWGVLVLGVLLSKTHRFSELRRAVGGVSEKMLAQTLQALERDGLIHREVHPVIPPRVEYSLTELGLPIAEQVRGLYRLIESSTERVLAAQAAYDERKPTR
ncbi:winged helix-turn-helix transcriptional regulator [Actinokineospora terrae]|uniref:Transcriptional regulator, HxlR family n=1 Tax=Actinokineospora terrae TaxID=155974 RepID=A0A1H9UJ83_9PSEU|nr:helix-turn-helix domain-containing protein [Actinokineospora terrae]SES09358.1 transcriptional regulator, HxlR family [Actinokineospora terrae]